MGIAPNGRYKPNGVDFWWDERQGNTGNRWCDNVGYHGVLTSDPNPIPGCDGPSVGTGKPNKDAELVDCGGPQSTGLPAAGCDWFTRPPKPNSSSNGPPAANRARPALFSGCGLGDSVRSGLAVLPGCGGSTATLFATSKTNTAPLQTTTCADWRRGGIGQRMQIVYGLATAATRPDPENAAPTLSEGRAYSVMEARCRPSYASGVLLYEIYNRAASFQALGG